ncbi:MULTISPECIES: P27 family phage terminase small subunit [unclassified Mesorhizobium]|uniref:P27 family phage terminase small subunit n=1 Tax=unclassified Mesorhizobium TaxID=325217 RepID=UPI000FE7FA64|nr:MULTISPECIES: P27 family phage terminase small subunit [unclassified Mesorhizobium]RWA62129.1 MAG: P27 family phage terminase small subunit [Mesorhizobium sp.]TGQ35336.1 P27 family phage terminase small subunit [Mesorhizobium sp. M4B.F.Ca.ET.214.01.1.1]
MGTRGPKSSAQLAIVSQAPASVDYSASVKAPAAPAHLSAASRKWWDEIVREYQLESHHLRLLQAACESWERMQAARAAIAKHGLTFVDAQGCPKARPEVAIERDAKVGFARLIRELDLDYEPPSESARPPAIRSNRG